MAGRRRANVTAGIGRHRDKKHSDQVFGLERKASAQARRRRPGPYSAASASLLPRFSFILRRPATIAFIAAGLIPLVMRARISARYILMSRRTGAAAGV